MAVMSRVLSAHFRTYLTGLEKMQAAVALQSDVLGVGEQVRKGGARQASLAAHC